MSYNTNYDNETARIAAQGFIGLGVIVASKRTGKVLGKVVHTYRDGVLMVFVKHDDGRSYRHQAMDLVAVK